MTRLLLSLAFLVGLTGLSLSSFLKGEANSASPLGTRQPGIDSELEGYPWLYQRDSTPVAEEETYNLVLVGDVLTGRLQGNHDDRETEKVATETTLTLPSPLQGADLLVGNLEGVFASGMQNVPILNPTQAAFTLAGSAQVARKLADAGFDLFSLANNHALDLGVEGLEATAGNLSQNGLAAFGAGASAQQAMQPLLRQLGSLKVAFLGVTAVTNPGQYPIPAPENPGWTPAIWGTEFLAGVHQARQEADLVIVMVHWGYEYQPREDPRQREMAQQLFQAGADLVVGSHPHVVQAVEVNTADGRPPQIVAYSLGNFLFDQESPGTNQGLALRVAVDKRGISGVQALPIAASLHPELLPAEKAKEMLMHLKDAPPPAVFACQEETCSELEAPDLSQRRIEGGLFWSGSSDLTGDGQPELVRQENEQVVVYKRGVETWRTPSEWQILDTALGDPDWDGRNEIMLAMLKPDAQGVLRSHPFIMGYRGGMYRNLWGGSAVSDPILEIELGNLDENPQQELVVLEEQKDGLRAVTVWDWHGWGFSLRWRSLEGEFENLRLARDPEGGADWIVVDYR